MTASIDENSPHIRLMCSFSGRIIPRPHDNQLRYVGGDTRMVTLHRNSTYSTLVSKLSKFTSINDVMIKYQLPNEDLDALISVTSDEDVENMIEEYDRLLAPANTPSTTRTPRLRLFLFNSENDGNNSSSGGFGSILSGTASKHESWFVDALNGRPLERGRSEASSIVSEVPDYLSGLDTNSDEQWKLKNNISLSDVGSPHYGSTSSAVSVPVETRPSELEPNPNLNPNPNPNSNPAPNPNPNPIWQYVNEQVPVYYVPSPVQMPMQYGQPQIPGGYRPVYVGGPYDYAMGPNMVGHAMVPPEANSIPGNIPMYRPVMGEPPAS